MPTNRREFLGAAAAAGSLAVARSLRAEDAAKTLRLGVIGTGWYGKCSLFRLLQVAPAEVVSL